VFFNTNEPQPDGSGDEIAWGLLSLAIFIEFMFFISVIFVTSPRMGIFALIVERLLFTDVREFLTFFFLYLTCFWATMFVTYPRAGVGQLLLVPPFNSMRDSFEAMLNVGIAGIHFDIDFSSNALTLVTDGSSTDLSSALRLANLVLFTIFYYCCMLFLVILLLRILMAMLSATYNDVRKHAELEWRLQFGRHVLHLQLVARSYGLSTMAGENLADDSWAHVFTTYHERADRPDEDEEDDELLADLAERSVLSKQATASSRATTRGEAHSQRRAMQHPHRGAMGALVAHARPSQKELLVRFSTSETDLLKA